MARKKRKNIHQELTDKFNQLQLSLNTNHLSIEDEVDLIKKFKDDLLKNQNKGKKVYVDINGEKIWISKSIIHKYRIACKLLSDREKNKQIVNIGHVENRKELSNSHKLYNQLTSELNGLKSAIYRSPALTEQYDVLKNRLTDSNIDTDTKCNMIRQFINQNIIIINFLNGKVQRRTEQPKPIDDVVFDDLQGYKETTKLTVEIKSEEEKPKRKSKFSSIFKKVAASVAAAVVLIFGSTVIKNSNQTTNEQTDETTVTHQTEHNTNKAPKIFNIAKKNDKTVSNLTVKIEKKEQKLDTKIQYKKSNITSKKVNKKQNNIKVSTKINKYLGFKFTLKKNSLVYSNMSNVNKKDNGYNPYYSNTDIRLVAGYGIRYNSQLITFVEKDENSYVAVNQGEVMYLTKAETEKQISSLVKKGGKIESIASRTLSNSQGIEGFYNYDDIKVLKKSI